MSKFLITLIGVGLTVALVLFLLAVYQGIKEAAVVYIERSRAEVWVSQKNANNLLKVSSFLRADMQRELAATQDVREVSGILKVLSATTIRGSSITMVLIGFEPQSEMGIPRTIIAGTSRIHNGEIILDSAFSKRHKIQLGDKLRIRDTDFLVRGICDKTNATIAQFSFITLSDARDLIGVDGIVSFFLVGFNHGTPGQNAAVLGEKFPNVSVFAKPAFINNNIVELNTGLLPVVRTISIFGTIISAVVITLMMYGSVVEKRELYAIMKAIGASTWFLVGLVVKQALFASVGGALLGLCIALSVAPLLSKFVPEVALAFVYEDVLFVLAGSVLIGLVSAVAPLRSISRIYPAEAFRA